MAEHLAYTTQRPARVAEIDAPALTVVVPSYNEAANLPLLYERLQAVLSRARIGWEVIIVDDHSADDTFDVARELARRDDRVRTIRLARNVGSHLAAMCGLEHSSGAATAVMSADLQDPPETLLEMFERWRNGDQVVWAVRASVEGRSVADSLFSRLYFWMMTRILRVEHVTPQGADFVLIDRSVADALIEYRERNLNLYAILAWLGFNQGTIYYAKQQRHHGKSGWTRRKKLKLVIDSITAFTYMPVRVMTLVGVLVAFLGFVYLIVVIANYFGGEPPEGWTSLVVIVLLIGGLQMAMLGVIGEYLWRCLDEARSRPRYHIERRAPLDWRPREMAQGGGTGAAEIGSDRRGASWRT
jgi:polyisoprenyl-phosphate glycosyltransferase